VGLNFASGFSGAASQLVINGPAAKINGTQLQLTDGGVNEASSTAVSIGPMTAKKVVNAVSAVSSMAKRGVRGARFF